MFDKTRVTCTRASLHSLLTPEERREVKEGEVDRIWGDLNYTAWYDTEDRAVRVARFLMNKDVPYVKRGQVGG